MALLTPTLATARTRATPALRPWQAWVAAWLLATVWGSVLQTQLNLQALQALGVAVPLPLRALTTLQDLAGFAPLYAGILAAGWLPALALAGVLARRWPSARTALLTNAAGLGMVAAVRAVDAIAPMPVFIDATRSWPGLLALAAGAALGGWLYARTTR